MKTIFALLAAFALASIVSAAEHLVVVPARGLSPDVAKSVLAELVSLAISPERLAPGSRIQVVDPAALDLLASLTVPPGTKSQREHNPAFARQVAALRTALLGLPAPRQPWEAQALRLPEIIRFISEQIVPVGDKATLLCIGSPLYRSSTGPFDFINGTVPGDGWLAAPAEDSPFSTSGLSLRGWSIHLATPQASWADSEWQAGEVRRFWAAYINAGGGNLVTLAPLNAAWERIRSGATNALGFRPVDANDRALVWRKRTFVRGQEAETTVKSNDMTKAPESPAPLRRSPSTAFAPIGSPPPADPIPSATVQPPAPEEVPEPPQNIPPRLSALEQRATALPTVGPERMGLGLVWETDKASARTTDLDSWVLVRGETECNYRTKSSGPAGHPHVRLYEDIRQAKGLDSTSDRQVFEFVEINRPVLPEDVELWVDIFQNSGKHPIRTLVQLEYRGRIYRQMIEFPGIAGDRASGANRRSQSPCWCRIDLVKLAKQPAAN